MRINSNDEHPITKASIHLTYANGLEQTIESDSTRAQIGMSAYSVGSHTITWKLGMTLPVGGNPRGLYTVTEKEPPVPTVWAVVLNGEVWRSYADRWRAEVYAGGVPGAVILEMRPTKNDGPA